MKGGSATHVRERGIYSLTLPPLGFGLFGVMDPGRNYRGFCEFAGLGPIPESLNLLGPDVIFAVDVTRLNPGRFAIWAFLTPSVTGSATSPDKVKPSTPLNASCDL